MTFSKNRGAHLCGPLDLRLGLIGRIAGPCAVASLRRRRARRSSSAADKLAAIMTRKRPLLMLTASLILAASAGAQVPTSVYDRVVADFDEQRYAEAEQTLWPALAEHPRDDRALVLMGVILDAQERFAEAETFYRRALTLAPNSASLYSNLANHYLAQGQSEKAHAAYLRAVELDPANRNANSQLAQISVTQKKGLEALHYLDRLPREDQASPAVQLLRGQALKLKGEASNAETLVLDVLKRSGQDPRVAYSVGMLFATWKDYGRAEDAFSSGLKSAPRDFELLYNLGLAALAAHDYDRSGQAFQEALNEHPGDVDCLIGLARVKDELHRDDQAAAVLFQAQRVAPDRADLLEFLGNVLDKLGLYRDAAVVYDHCLKVHPENDEARRFYILTIVGLFILRSKQPNAPRPYKAFGYPFLPILYIAMAAGICAALLRYKPQYTWPGLILVLLGIPVYLYWSRKKIATA